MALAFSAGIFGPKINDVEQIRNNNVAVTRVPMIPLYTLLVLKLLYVLVVVALAIGAYLFTHPAETEVIRDQLSVKGLAMSYFKHPDVRRANVMGKFKSQFGSISSDTTVTDEAKAWDVARELQVQEQGQGTKVGLVPTPDGKWTFALFVDETWHNVKPVVKVLVMQKAKEKKLGVFGDAYVAWKK